MITNNNFIGKGKGRRGKEGDGTDEEIRKCAIGERGAREIKIGLFVVKIHENITINGNATAGEGLEGEKRENTHALMGSERTEEISASWRPLRRWRREKNDFGAYHILLP